MRLWPTSVIAFRWELSELTFDTSALLSPRLAAAAANRVESLNTDYEEHTTHHSVSLQAHHCSVQCACVQCGSTALTVSAEALRRGCIAQCTVRSAQCMFYSAHRTFHSAQSSVYSAQCTPHTACFTVYSAHCMLYSARYTMHNTRCTMHSSYSKEHITLHTAYCTVHTKTAHWTLHIAHQTV